MYNFERIHSENNTLAFIPAQLAIPREWSVSNTVSTGIFYCSVLKNFIVFLYLDDNENQSKL